MGKHFHSNPKWKSQNNPNGIYTIIQVVSLNHNNPIYSLLINVERHKFEQYLKLTKIIK